MIQLSKDATPFGREIYSWLEENQISSSSILKIVGMGYLDRFVRFLESENSMITLDLLFKIADLSNKSPSLLLQLIYENQATTARMPKEVRERDLRFLLLFDRFFRLAEKEQQTILGLTQSLFSEGTRSSYTAQETAFLWLLRKKYYPDKPIVTLQDVAEHAMIKSDFSHVTLGKRLGVGPYYLKRLFLHVSKGVALTKSVYLPIAMQVAETLKISPIRFFLLLYTHHDEQARERERLNALESQYYELFSRFYQLEEGAQDEVIWMADSLVRLSHSRDLPQDQLDFINNFRVQPVQVRRRKGVESPPLEQIQLGA